MSDRFEPAMPVCVGVVMLMVGVFGRNLITVA